MGPKCAELAVERPEQYHFDRDALLVSIVYFLVRLSEQPAFVQAVSAVRWVMLGRVGKGERYACLGALISVPSPLAPPPHTHPLLSSLPPTQCTTPPQVPDYDASIIQRAVEVLASKELGEYEHRRRLEALAAAVAELRGEPVGGADAAGGELPPPDLSFPQAEEPADLEAAYVAALEPLSVGEFDSGAPRAYNRSFAAKAERQVGDTSGAGWVVVAVVLLVGAEGCGG